MLTTKTGQVLTFSKNINFMTSLCEILSDFGYLAAGFSSWEEALDALKEKNFDLFITDIETPENESMLFLQTALKIDPHLVGIIITRQGLIQNALEAIKKGAFDYIIKPFKLESLLVTMSRAMEVRRLRKAKDIYCSMFEKAVEGIYLITPEERYITVNPAMAHIFGYELPDDFLKILNDIKQKLYVAPEQRAEFIRLIQKSDIVTGFESQVYRKNGNTIWISENVNAIRDTNGTLLYYRGTIEDITIRKQAEDMLRESESRYRLCAEKAEQNTDVFLKIIDDICDSYKNLNEQYMSFLKAIVNALDEKSPWTKGHSERVAIYAEKIARGMGLGEDEVQKLRLAALLHDIGKVGTFDHLINKPEKLSDKEYECVKLHPVQSVMILKKVKQLKDILPYVKHHHERIDGKGYPEGLKGEKIPFCARILHVADSYDSMTIDRPYRTSCGKEYAFLELKRCNGSQFDPQVAEIALKVL